VRWVPPWSLAARMRWALEHPWIAACYFGAYMFLVVLAVAFVVPPLVGASVSFEIKVGLALGSGLLAALVFGLALRTGWAERHGFGTTDLPSFRRPLSTLPDRVLTRLAWIAPAAILLIGLGLIVGPMRWIDLVSVTFSLMWLVLVTLERRHRRRERGENSSSPPQSQS
jgi:hypothetical protein